MKNQERQRLEALVISEATATWQRGCNLPTDLWRAVRALCELPLDEPSKAPTNRGAPVTAKQAGEWLEADDRALSAAGRVFRCIYHHGGTADSVSERLEMPHQTCSARVNQLSNTGWIADSGHRWRTRSGRQAIVWRPSQAATDALREGLNP